ncbi:MAG: sulfite exporter TauE/SafE family protein [Myxococcales bacterium]|nr:sulfite exporter TauE/SafE family protein [Myxococcales bacterium]
MSAELAAAALGMGLVGSLHCVAMCGGVSATLCGAGGACERPRDRLPRRVGYAAAYNLGRVLTYVALGALFGGWASLGLEIAPGLPVRTGLRVVAALAVLAVALHLAGVFPAYKVVERLGVPLWSRVAPLARRLLREPTPARALALGAVWGLIPCGLLYGTLFVAAGAGSAAGGAVVMAAFGLGTLPALGSIGAFASSVGSWLARAWVRRTAGVVLGGLATWSLLAALAGSGVIDGAYVGLGPAHACCGAGSPHAHR